MAAPEHGDVATGTDRKLDLESVPAVLRLLAPSNCPRLLDRLVSRSIGNRSDWGAISCRRCEAIQQVPEGYAKLVPSAGWNPLPYRGIDQANAEKRAKHQRKSLPHHKFAIRIVLPNSGHFVTSKARLFPVVQQVQVEGPAPDGHPTENPPK